MLIALSACSIRSDGDDEASRVSICEPIVYENSPFTHCIAQPGEHAIAMDLSAGDSDKPYRSLGALSRSMG
ncbi:MAG: hypothetical protein WA957_00545, partial [Alteraurantiacibacter sp.]